VALGVLGVCVAEVIGDMSATAMLETAGETLEEEMLEID
jgi:hypothetical protein